MAPAAADSRAADLVLGGNVGRGGNFDKQQCVWPILCAGYAVWSVVERGRYPGLGDPDQQTNQSPTQWLGCAILAMAMVVVLAPDVPWMFCSPQRFNTAKMSGFPFMEAQLVAQKVAEAETRAMIWFMWPGRNPEILYYARRFSPTRFITTYALMIPTPVAERYQREAMVDLAKNPPALVVLVKTANSWLRQDASPGEFTAFLKFVFIAKLRARGRICFGREKRGIV